MDTPPPPKITTRLPDLHWPRIWQQLWRPRSHMEEEVNTGFQLLHHILPLKGRLARFGNAAGALCPHCNLEAEDTLHAFCRCQRVADLWQHLLTLLLPHTGPLDDMDLLLLAWPPLPRDNDLRVTMLCFIHLIWSSRSSGFTPSISRLTENLRAKPSPFLPLW